MRRYRQYLYAYPPQAFDDKSSAASWAEWRMPLHLADGRCLSFEKAVGHNKVLALATPADGVRLEIRFRAGGERLYLAERGGHHALKKCFQEWGIPPWLRDSIPLLYINDTLACVINYAVASDFRAPEGKDAWHITIKDEVKCEQS